MSRRLHRNRGKASELSGKGYHLSLKDPETISHEILADISEVSRTSKNIRAYWDDNNADAVNPWEFSQKKILSSQKKISVTSTVKLNLSLGLTAGFPGFGSLQSAIALELSRAKVDETVTTHSEERNFTKTINCQPRTRNYVGIFIEESVRKANVSYKVPVKHKAASAHAAFKHATHRHVFKILFPLCKGHLTLEDWQAALKNIQKLRCLSDNWKVNEQFLLSLMPTEILTQLQSLATPASTTFLAVSGSTGAAGLVTPASPSE